MHVYIVHGTRVFVSPEKLGTQPTFEDRRKEERGRYIGEGGRERMRGRERAREGWGESARGGERRRGRERESKRRAEISFMIERVLKKEKKMEWNE